MSSAESILYDIMSEVHPGAGSVRRSLAEHGNSRYLYEMYVIAYDGMQVEWNRDNTASISEAVFLCYRKLLLKEK